MRKREELIQKINDLLEVSTDEQVAIIDIFLYFLSQDKRFKQYDEPNKTSINTVWEEIADSLDWYFWRKEE